VQWDGKRFHWIEEDIKDLPLTLDEPPSDERFSEIIKTVGQRAKDAIRVEVPFSMVAPADDQWWTHDSRGGIEIPLGRAGATKFQYLRLGKGTSQHVLISGKTGSGKSTLLHAMIANTALHYGPDEVHFYLIDFKKGVEFKPYATYQLPHARVIAIESEREFGMSVLERLDLELRTRGDLFRDHGVADIKSFRDANPDTALPRIMLIIDEFQEFFIQDDKVSQDAALLLDRLVRQGRAFGIHVLLGSQTLAGAYSLARSTLGQMAVRIALQCSEADSHLILSEDNTAARLLDRPGEAIYNDANGLFEGNHPFQVVWLGSTQQETYLRRLKENANNDGRQLTPPIVFEGNAPADPRENGPLRAALTQEKVAASSGPTAWLGSAVAIKDPTSILFRRQSGNNVLLVGQQDETLAGIMGNALVSLAATIRSNAESDVASFYVFDGARSDATEAHFWPRVVEELSIGVKLVDTKGVGDAMTAIASELQRRMASGDETAPSIFLFIHNLSRFRDLRRADDDFSFSSVDDDKPQTPNKQFVDILREGPAVGIHTLVWCDTYNNVNRWLDRQTLRDLDYRVLCQMSATDSSNLMDSPAASRLGTHRALLFSEEQGSFEKFRPYAPPSSEWLGWVREQLMVRNISVT
jgi:energy-coupling factor transporter ATP-binding protein EcfA2